VYTFAAASAETREASGKADVKTRQQGGQSPLEKSALSSLSDQKLFGLIFEWRDPTGAGVCAAAGFEESAHGRIQPSDWAQAGHDDFGPFM
jgi:hypothetical protein